MRGRLGKSEVLESSNAGGMRTDGRCSQSPHRASSRQQLRIGRESEVGKDLVDFQGSEFVKQIRCAWEVLVLAAVANSFRGAT